jgi:hypothetical protein
MAPIADIARVNRIRFTAQQIADFMLSEDQARRRAQERGDEEAVARHDAELERLAKLLP